MGGGDSPSLFQSPSGHDYGEHDNLHQAKTSLSRLVNRVANGEEIIIAKAGVPVARLVPVTRKGARRKPGGWKGRVRIASDFDAPLPPDIQRAFEGA